MIGMGVSSRAGESLFFGNTATALLKDGAIPMLMVAT
jgi:hypothetical protein